MTVKQTNKQISDALNNVVVFSFAKVNKEKLHRLRDYATALLEPLLEHIEDKDMELINEESAIFVLSSLALILQKRIDKSTKVPALGEAAKLFTNE